MATDVTDSPIGAARSRLWEIDALRGLAILAMVAFHSAWDWAYFHDGALGPASRYFSGAIAGSFIMLLGISISLDRDRVHAAGDSLVLRTVSRVALIGGAACLVTLSTWLVLPDSFVYFGILHLLTASTLAVALTARLGTTVNALIGAAVFVIGWSGLLDVPAPEPWLAFLGWDAPRSTVDWYPLAPWAGFAFIGFAVGRVLYQGRRHRFSLPKWDKQTGGLRVLGRHSLPIYLTHQLILFPLFWALVTVLP
ncbi:MAG TPA: heparan-alpha-glucosaminide N-acetyltransferase [Thermoleophilia bacterium]|nr:heparan-alpha-glucosaminide N-acetyltransferase [Thermoleophilia bacterium]